MHFVIVEDIETLDGRVAPGSIVNEEALETMVRDCGHVAAVCFMSFDIAARWAEMFYPEY